MEKRKSKFGGLGVLGGLMLVVLGAAGIYLQTTNVQFHYGDWYYWLATNAAVREFPIVVAQPGKIVFEEETSDGAQPKKLRLSYISRKSNAEVLSYYRKACRKLGYSLIAASLEEPKLGYRGKGEVKKLSICVYPTPTLGSRVEVSFEKS